MGIVSSKRWKCNMQINHLEHPDNWFSEIRLLGTEKLFRAKWKFISEFLRAWGIEERDKWEHLKPSCNAMQCNASDWTTMTRATHRQTSRRKWICHRCHCRAWSRHLGSWSRGWFGGTCSPEIEWGRIGKGSAGVVSSWNHAAMKQVTEFRH